LLPQAAERFDALRRARSSALGVHGLSHTLKLWIIFNPVHHWLLLAVCCRLLSALTLSEDHEAARLVIMGWPSHGKTLPAFAQNQTLDNT
jgi:hypothetical protein